MQSNIDDFFIPDNEVKLPEELDYSRAVEYIRSAEAFSRSTYQSVYIIDYFKRNIKNQNMKNKLFILVAYGLIALTGQAQKNLPRFKYSKEPAVLTGNIVGDSTERLEDVNVTIIR